MRCLLINPWIHDFSALNFWSSPLGLLRVAEFLSQFDVEILSIDCLETTKYKPYGTGRYNRQPIPKPLPLKQVPRKFSRYGITPEEFQFRLKSFLPVDIIFITSIMTYWYTGVAEAIYHIRKVFGSTPVILGGIYATLCPEHALINTGVDLVHRGKIENGLDTELRRFGFTPKKNSEKKPYYKITPNLFNRQWQFAPLSTASGCIFLCTYCASRFIDNNFVRKDHGEILKEIEELYSLGIRDFAFYDDALLVDSENHIKPILRKIMHKGISIRLHTPNGIHVRFVDEELVMLMKAAGFKTLRLSLETVSPERQRLTGGKASTDELLKAVSLFKNAGFEKKEIGVYLMYGLPGQNLLEIENGVRFLMSLGVSIYLTEFSPIPKTKMWNEMVLNGIISNDIDLLLTNNSVYYYLYSGYNLKELERIKLYVKSYNAA